MSDLAIYVHWPFCQAKCPYCDFNSHVRHGGIDEPRFRSAYLRELDHAAGLRGAGPATSVFFGGGTPSLMSADTVAAILDHIAGLWSLTPDAEITLEANPTSVEAARFAGYRDAGVNRLSLGVQALEDRDLVRLGRRHTVAEALAALDLAEQHFPRVSFDLIYARPGQTEADWEAELAAGLARAPGHLSLYQLTIEPGTPFAALHAEGRLGPPGPERAANLFELTQDMTEAAGLGAYEISNHARPGQASRHNLAYWRGADYVGVGPGAHGRLTFGGQRHATQAIAAPEDWCKAVDSNGHGFETVIGLSAAEIGEEYLLMGMRLSEGIDLGRYARTGAPALDEARIAGLAEAGLLEQHGDRLATTAQGRLVLNAIIAELVAS